MCLGSPGRVKDLEGLKKEVKKRDVFDLAIFFFEKGCAG
jgi:hypothetical protein